MAELVPVDVFLDGWYPGWTPELIDDPWLRIRVRPFSKADHSSSWFADFSSPPRICTGDLSTCGGVVFGPTLPHCRRAPPPPPPPAPHSPAAGQGGGSHPTWEAH